MVTKLTRLKATKKSKKISQPLGSSTIRKRLDWFNLSTTITHTPGEKSPVKKRIKIKFPHLGEE